jgi:hypothetical protein
MVIVYCPILELEHVQLECALANKTKYFFNYNLVADIFALKKVLYE